MEHPTPPNDKRQRVVVGLSGGVDSSVTAALLKQQGYDVVGVYMKNWNTESPTLGKHTLEKDEYRMECPWYDDYLDAKRVALQLEIPFHLWDFREAYKKKVFDHFIEEFAAGRTPNPDVYCNSLVKFDDFQQRAITELGADYVATGHYARRVQDGENYFLQIPADTAKDQTYFLYRLSQAQLAKAMFPLAEYTKKQVRELAQQFGLPTKYKKDSQGICFVGDVEIREFIGQWLAPKPGSVEDENGNVIGAHQGVHFHTIGEKIAVDNAVIAKLHPEQKHAISHYYVTRKDVVRHVLVAVPGADHPSLYTTTATLERVHWTASSEQVMLPLYARIRHGGALLAVASVETRPEQVTVAFAEPVRAVTPGQHLVLYNENRRVIGGGVIA